MLVYHYGDPPGPDGHADPLRATFAADLAALGDWPQLPRRVAIANGSDNGTGQGFGAGAQLIEWSYSSIFVVILGNAWAVPNVTTTKIFDGRVRILFSTTQQTLTTSNTKAYDNAPGGSRATMAEMDAVAAPYGDIIALYPSHCFIPTVSALAYDTPDLFHDIAADANPVSHTPFDAIYTQGTNQEHVAITAQNAAWIKSEVENVVTGVGPVAGASPMLRAPAPDPSSGPVRLDFTLARQQAVDVRVFGVDGREVARLARGVWDAGSHELTWSGKDARGAEVRAGVYFVRLAADRAVETRRFVRF